MLPNAQHSNINSIWPELELHFPIYNFKSKALESEKMAYIT